LTAIFLSRVEDRTLVPDLAFKETENLTDSLDVEFDFEDVENVQLSFSRAPILFQANIART